MSSISRSDSSRNAIDQNSAINDVMDRHRSLERRGFSQRLPSKDVAQVLAELLFEVTKAVPSDGLVRVRSYEEIAAQGPFKYAGQIGTMLKEGLIPREIYDGLVEAQAGAVKKGDESHVGPSYLKVKSLMTNWRVRLFAARQVAYAILDSLRENPPENKDGYIVCIPNMTGGAFIGDEIAKQLSELNFSGPYRIWPFTPYMRAMRKETEVLKTKPQLNSLVEGSLPPPEKVAALPIIEELRTAAETTSNAARTYIDYGYGPENRVRLLDVCFFDYRHPVGVERMRRMNIPGVYVVTGMETFGAAHNSGLLETSRFETVRDWLSDPWKFTARILPDMRRLKEEQDRAQAAKIASELRSTAASEPGGRG